MGAPRGLGPPATSARGPSASGRRGCPRSAPRLPLAPTASPSLRLLHLANCSSRSFLLILLLFLPPASCFWESPSLRSSSSQFLDPVCALSSPSGRTSAARRQRQGVNGKK